MRIKNAGIVLAGCSATAVLAASPAGAATSSLPNPSVTAVLEVQKQAMANGAPGALTRIDSGSSSYRIASGQA
ncbi:serine hydrolase, partial [Streptomyces sp. NPDC026673]